MAELPSAAVRADLGRTRVGRLVLVSIVARGPGTIGEIADRIRTDPKYVRWAVEGRKGKYRPQQCLLAHGLVRVTVEQAGGRSHLVVAATPSGDRVARWIVSLGERDAEVAHSSFASRWTLEGQR